MTDFEKITGCVHHTVEACGYRRFRVDVFRDSTLVDVDADGECRFDGGHLVATLYRATEDLAHGAGIAYSFVTATGPTFRGVDGIDFAKGRRVAV